MMGFGSGGAYVRIGMSTCVEYDFLALSSKLSRIVCARSAKGH